MAAHGAALCSVGYRWLHYVLQGAGSSSEQVEREGAAWRAEESDRGERNDVRCGFCAGGTEPQVRMDEIPGRSGSCRGGFVRGELYGLRRGAQRECVSVPDGRDTGEPESRGYRALRDREASDVRRDDRALPVDGFDTGFARVARHHARVHTDHREEDAG